MTTGRWTLCEEGEPENYSRVEVFNGVVKSLINWEPGVAFFASDVCWRYTDELGTQPPQSCAPCSPTMQEHAEAIDTLRGRVEKLEKFVQDELRKSHDRIDALLNRLQTIVF